MPSTPKPPPSSLTSSACQDAEQVVWDYLRLLASGSATQEDLDAFQDWVQSDFSHVQAYQRVRQRWDALKSLSQAHTENLNEQIDGFRRRRLVQRRAIVGAGLAVVGIGTLAISYPPLDWWPKPEEWGADYRTAVGEQRQVAVAQGVDVLLNTRTSMRREFEAGRMVGMQLVSGEAVIELHLMHELSVYAGAAYTRAQVAQFGILHWHGQSCVSCLNGEVSVHHPQGVRYLHARQQVRYSPENLGQVVSFSPEQESSWREGVLVFRETPLGQVLNEINRYRSGKVFVASAKLNTLLVSGQFRIDALELALSQLEYSLDLKARYLPGNIVVLS